MDTSWEDRWRTANTPWDAAGSPPALDYWLRTYGEQAAASGRRALVPGCGSGYDVFTLAWAGWVVTGLDLAPSVMPRFQQLRSEAGLSESTAQLVVGDFFAWEPEQPFHLIWDYTFLCALPRSERERWKQKQLKLLAPDGELVTLLFPVDPARPPEQGPPFSLDPDELAQLLAPELTISSIEPPPASHPGRVGLELLARWARAEWSPPAPGSSVANLR